jgi:mannosyltransferase
MLTAVAAVLRFFHLGAKSLWFDEALTAMLARAPWHGFARTVWRGGEANMALYYEIMRAWTHLGTREWALRSFSALVGVAAIPVFYLLGRRLFGPAVGLIAALLLTVNACHVAYSQEARSYALFFLLAILSSYFLMRAVESGATSDYLAYALISALSVYSHFFAFLLIGAQALSLIALPRGAVRWRKLLIAVALLAVLVLPALFFVMGRNTGQLAWVPKPTARDLQRFGYFLVADQGTLRQPLLAAYLVLAGLALIFSKRRNAGPLARFKFILLLSWFLFPMAVAFVASLWKPVFMPRFLIFCLAPLLLLTGVGLAQIRSTALRIALTLTLACASLVPTLWYYRQPKEQWREAVSYIATHAQSGDAVILFGNYARVPFDYYQPRMTWPPGVSFIRAADSRSPEALPTKASMHTWLLMHGQPSDPAAAALERNLAGRYGEPSDQSFFMVTVRRYTNPTPSPGSK